MITIAIIILFVYKSKKTFPTDIDKDKIYRLILVFVVLTSVFSVGYTFVPYEDQVIRENLLALINLLYNMNVGFLFFLFSEEKRTSDNMQAYKYSNISIKHKNVNNNRHIRKSKRSRHN